MAGRYRCVHQYGIRRWMEGNGGDASGFCAYAARDGLCTSKYERSKCAARMDRWGSKGSGR